MPQKGTSRHYKNGQIFWNKMMTLPWSSIVYLTMKTLQKQMMSLILILLITTCKEDAFVKSHNGVQCRKETTKGWEVLICWKDGSTTWNKLKDVKDSYPVQLAEFSIQQGIQDEPAFCLVGTLYYQKERKDHFKG